jgi:glucosamine-6-phosphate deaminase
MTVNVYESPEKLGRETALHCCKILNKALLEKGYARIVLSTGASQFETLKELIKQDIDWSRIEMFHLDEYVNLPETHPASFRKYLKERFISKVNLKAYHLVNGNGDVTRHIQELTKKIGNKTIDLGLIGIGENGHIAFNDPPADFEIKKAYITVDLDDGCKRQQVREGWFNSIDEVPSQAVSMTPYQIMKCKSIVSAVPGSAKSQAV